MQNCYSTESLNDMDESTPLSNLTWSDTMNAEQAATLMFAETDTVLTLARNGSLPGTKIGKSWVFLREDVLTFLRHRVQKDTEERLRQLGAPKDPVAVLIEPPPKRRRRPPPALPGLPPFSA
jgi:excisionase family DNA binding protein